MNMPSDRVTARRLIVAALACLSMMSAPMQADEQDRRQAKRMYDRLTGVAPTGTVVQAPDLTVLDLMEQDLSAGDALGAATRAMQDPAFYNVTLKNFATPWTNRDQDVFAELNDYTATVIGMIRDEVPFNQVLSGDIVYVGDAASGVPAYSVSDNAHYRALESQAVDLQQHLVRKTQSELNPDLPPAATAGVTTTRAAAAAFFVAGTNRAMFRFTLMNHLCTDLEPLKDVTRSPDRIRQDVSRSPGGDSRIFNNACLGCHAGMDPLAQAFAYYQFNEATGRMEYTDGVVQPKYHINADNFKYGYITPDDRWDNYWRAGANAFLGWDAGLPGGGNGAKSLGVELANSGAFARCQVTKVYRAVCLRDPDESTIAILTDAFVNKTDYSMKRVFAEAAVRCMGP